MSAPRDDAIDILRGIAVVTMIAANLAAKALAEPHPFWFRAFGSYAAPLFVLLLGMMVGRAHRQGKRGLGFFVVRGLMLVAGGAFVDICLEGIRPFTSMDVLYLLGISLPLAFLCCLVPAPLRWGMVLVIFAAAPLLQNHLGYTEYPTEYELDGERVRESAEAATQTSIAQHVLIDGWFPLVPWFGFAVLGVAGAGLRWPPTSASPVLQTRPFSIVTILAVSTLLLSIGVGLALVDPGPMLTRGGYSELFYPPTLWYLFTACGVMLLLFGAADRLAPYRVCRPLQVFGQSALFSYFLHRGIISYVIPDRGQTMPTFLAIYAAVTAFCLAACYVLRWAWAWLVEFLDLRPR